MPSSFIKVRIVVPVTVNNCSNKLFSLSQTVTIPEILLTLNQGVIEISASVNQDLTLKGTFKIRGFDVENNCATSSVYGDSVSLLKKSPSMLIKENQNGFLRFTGINNKEQLQSMIDDTVKFGWDVIWDPYDFETLLTHLYSNLEIEQKKIETLLTQLYSNGDIE